MYGRMYECNAATLTLICAFLCDLAGRLTRESAPLICVNDPPYQRYLALVIANTIETSMHIKNKIKKTTPHANVTALYHVCKIQKVPLTSRRLRICRILLLFLVTPRWTTETKTPNATANAHPRAGERRPLDSVGDGFGVGDISYSPDPSPTMCRSWDARGRRPVPYTHFRTHETVLDLVCRVLLEKKKIKNFEPTLPCEKPDGVVSMSKNKGERPRPRTQCAT